MAPSSKHIHQILTRYHFTLSRKSNIGLTQLAPSAHSGQKYQLWFMKIYLDIEFQDYWTNIYLLFCNVNKCMYSSCLYRVSDMNILTPKLIYCGRVDKYLGIIEIHRAFAFNHLLMVAYYCNVRWHGSRTIDFSQPQMTTVQLKCML